MTSKTTIVALRQQNLELEHYGVKGMKWGVRKQRPRSNRPKRERQERIVSDQAAQQRELRARIKTHGLDSLSTQELQTYVRRLNLEQQYDRMNPGAVAKGNQWLKTVAGTLGTLGALYAFSKSPIMNDVKAAMVVRNN